MVHIGHIISYKTIRTLSIYLFIGLSLSRLSPHHALYVRFSPSCPNIFLMPQYIPYAPYVPYVPYVRIVRIKRANWV
jgi:hypothetical protein